MPPALLINILQFFVLCSVTCLLRLNSCVEFKYHSNSELYEVLKQYTISNLTEDLKINITQIGTSSRNATPIWALSITAAKEDLLAIPNVKYVANMHGNQAVGRELIIQFIDYLFNNYKTNQTIQWLLNNTKLHFVPTLNPDGFAVAREGLCFGDYGRYNLDGETGFDLNENFPDFFHNRSKIANSIQRETEAMINWSSRIPFVLSASFFTGDMVVSYPYSDAPMEFSDGNTRPSLTKDDDVFQHLARVYASHNPHMSRSKICVKHLLDFKVPAEPDDNVCRLKSTGCHKNGIINGADWYYQHGTMADYMYDKFGCMELIIAMSCCFYPYHKHLQEIWLENLQSILYLTREAHVGISGIIYDVFALRPVENVTITILEKNISFKSLPSGEFFRLLRPGTYILLAEHPNYLDTYLRFTVPTYTMSEFPELLKIEIILWSEEDSYMHGHFLKVPPRIPYFQQIEQNFYYYLHKENHFGNQFLLFDDESVNESSEDEASNVTNTNKMISSTTMQSFVPDTKTNTENAIPSTTIQSFVPDTDTNTKNVISSTTIQSFVPDADTNTKNAISSTTMQSFSPNTNTTNKTISSTTMQSFAPNKAFTHHRPNDACLFFCEMVRLTVLATLIVISINFRVCGILL